MNWLWLWFASAASVPAAPSQLPDGMACLLAAYPEHLCGGDATHIKWCDGTKMQWQLRDASVVEHRELLNVADLRDQMSQRYMRAWTDKDVPPLNHDPGRLRYEPFFRRMYGNSARAVDKTLAVIHWLPKHVNKRLKVTTVNRVHERLAAVSAELDELPARLRKYVEETSGTFVWRTVKGTKRLSMHSFAIAVDVGVPFSDYWKWRKPGKDGRYIYRNRMPKAIVDVFEKHGFVWGGKWYHFDTMHFEYRPELLAPECMVERAE